LHTRDGIGILYASGNSSQMGLTKDDGAALLRKPYRPEDMVRSLKLVEQIVTTGEASQPFPKGFSVLSGSSPKSGSLSDSADHKDDGIRRLLRQQGALAEFGSYALGERDLKKVLTEAARVCAAGLGVPFCKVCRFRPEHNDLLVEAGVGWHQGVVGNVVSRADESSPQGRAFITGEPVICSNVNTDVTFVLPAFYADHGIISTIDVIIKKQGQPYGVLEIDSPIEKHYDRHDVNFLTGFANVLAEAVNTAERNAVVERTIEQMRETVADRNGLLARQSALLVEKNILLDEKSRLLDDKEVMGRELQHRVRNNLHLVHGMLNKQLQADEGATSNEGIRAIARRVMALSEVYDHLLGAGLSRTIDFGGYLSSLCTEFAALETSVHPNVALICQIEPTLLDLDSVTALGLVVSELIANSYGHAFPSGAGTISVSLYRSATGNGATLVFADDGAGFIESGDSKRQGLGLVRRLMQQVGGTATLNSQHGSEWTLTFPMPTSDAH
jgi:two-component sensor histidine kinase